MGDEIRSSVFFEEDYQSYFENLEAETQLLNEWFENEAFAQDEAKCGIEQEAWIVNESFYPAPENQYLLDTLQSDLLSPELAKFNIELNVTPQYLADDGLRKLHVELAQLWQTCENTLSPKDLHMLMVGILPTVRDKELVMENMSVMNRYFALNEQVLKARQGKPLNLDIVGEEHLKSVHSDVMLESAATSFQIHRQVPFHCSARYYNAAILLSAPMVAIAANSPFLFGKNLWHETRIPLFEQAVEVGGYGHASAGPIRRVSFGNGYARKSIMECFKENLDHFPVLLPVKFDDPREKLRHLRMHNGTIWRWNRPLIGFSDDNVPHLRIEHRVVSAGPTIIDEVANTTFFYGLQEYYANCEEPPESLLEFSKAKNNFYLASQHGLDAKVTWLNGESVNIAHLILEDLLEKSRLGLNKLTVDTGVIDEYLNIIYERAKSKQNGSVWQANFITKNGRDMRRLTECYWENQATEKPVHEWSL